MGILYQDKRDSSLSSATQIFYTGKVISVDDDSDGGRIKVWIPEIDNNSDVNNLPYCFPLFPKIIHIMPKVGESVQIFNPNMRNNIGYRYWIGPIISQPQNMYYEDYTTASTLLSSGIFIADPSYKNNSDANGIFPSINDVALIGRKNEDLILKENEIDIRVGRSAINSDNRLIFNSESIGYIQLKYNETTEDKSFINIVADKINLLSHKSNRTFNVSDKKELISDSEMKEILSEAHQLPYGDILVEMLEIIRMAITEHVHPYPNMTAVPGSIIERLNNLQFNDILSESIRIN